MSIELHNVPSAITPDKVTNVIIEHGLGRIVFSRIENSNIVQVRITHNILNERKQSGFMLTIDEVDTMCQNLDLEEVEFVE